MRWLASEKQKRQELFPTSIWKTVMIQKNFVPMVEKEDSQPSLLGWRQCKAHHSITQS